MDLLVLSAKGFFLVEIKSRPGTLAGDSGTWQWEHGGRRFSEDSPLVLANRKAKKLASRLGHTKGLRGAGRLGSGAPRIAPVRSRSRVISLRDGSGLEALRGRLAASGATLLPPVDEAALADLKFASCLPRRLAVATLEARARDDAGTRHCLTAPLVTAADAAVPRAPRRTR